MSLAGAVHSARAQTIKVGLLASKLARYEAQGRDYWIETFLLRLELRRERSKLLDILETRSWALVDGLLQGRWVQCARLHDCYSETPEADGWRSETLLGKDFWLCSLDCTRIWRARQTAKLDEENSRSIEMTFHSGKKAILKTTGKTLTGHRLAESESV